MGEHPGTPRDSTTEGQHHGRTPTRVRETQRNARRGWAAPGRVGSGKSSRRSAASSGCPTRLSAEASRGGVRRALPGGSAWSPLPGQAKHGSDARSPEGVRKDHRSRMAPLVPAPPPPAASAMWHEARGVIPLTDDPATGPGGAARYSCRSRPGPPKINEPRKPTGRRAAAGRLAKVSPPLVPGLSRGFSGALPGGIHRKALPVIPPARRGLPPRPPRPAVPGRSGSPVEGNPVEGHPLDVGKTRPNIHPRPGPSRPRRTRDAA